MATLRHGDRVKNREDYSKRGRIVEFCDRQPAPDVEVKTPHVEVKLEGGSTDYWPLHLTAPLEEQPW